jgi:hypothetical protein
MIEPMAREPRWVKDEDLVETVYDLRIVNSATKTKASSPHDAEIFELGSKGLALRVPRTLCATGHLLSLELTFRRKNDAQVLSKLIMTGKVQTVSPIDASSNLVSVRLYQFEVPAWEDFCKKHNDRRIRVSDAIRQRQS